MSRLHLSGRWYRCPVPSVGRQCRQARVLMEAKLARPRSVWYVEWNIPQSHAAAGLLNAVIQIQTEAAALSC